MSNEYKDWIWENCAENAIEIGLFDRVFQVIPYNDLDVLVRGIKDGFDIAYNMWYDRVGDRWVYERSKE